MNPERDSNGGSGKKVVEMFPYNRGYPLEANAEQHVESGGGPPHDGNMNERIARLEASFEHVDKTLDEIRTDLRDARNDRAAMRERLAKMPTTNGLWGMVATVLGIGIAIAGLTFVIADYASRM